MRKIHLTTKNTKFGEIIFRNLRVLRDLRGKNSFPCGSLLRRVALGHFIEEAFLLKLLQEAQVDELLRFRRLGLGHLRRQAVEQELQTLQRRVRFLWRCGDVSLVRSLQHLGIVGAHVFAEYFQRARFVAENGMNAFDVTFERRLDDVAVALDLSARRRHAVALDFDFKVGNSYQLDQPHALGDG